MPIHFIAEEARKTIAEAEESESTQSAWEYGEAEIKDLQDEVDAVKRKLMEANLANAALKLYLARAKGKGKGGDGNSYEDQSRYKVTGIGNIYIYIHSFSNKTKQNKNNTKEG